MSVGLTAAQPPVSTNNEPLPVLLVIMVLKQMKTRLIIVTVVTNLMYEAAIAAGCLWLLPLLGFRMPLWGLLLCMVIFAAWAAFCFRIGLRTIQRKPLGGLTDMIATEGIATSRLDPVGYIKIEGELWRAESKQGRIEPGTRVEVIGQKELKLVVREKEETNTNKKVQYYK